MKKGIEQRKAATLPACTKALRFYEGAKGAISIAGDVEGVSGMEAHLGGLSLVGRRFRASYELF
jgi:hypothetical protein